MAKRAVVVGINDYAPIGGGGPDLRGCVNDARDMANTLVICGFPVPNIRILTDRNATKANILNYLRWLVSTSVRGDSIVFYYSGHGTRVTNVGADLEIEGLDEAICPHDFNTAGFITDDVFKSIFDTLKPGVNLEVIFDCCHSGTGTRILFGPNFELNRIGVENDEYSAVRTIEPMLEDEFYYAFHREFETDENKKALPLKKALVPVSTLNHTLWAACKENQVSMEGNIGGSIRGYFTYHFCRCLRSVSGNITRRLLDAQVANALHAMGAAQINQTESKNTEFAQRIFT